MKFSFRTATEIHFGPGEAKRLREHAARFGKRPFVVTGSRGFAGLDGPSVRVSGEPDVAAVDAAVRLCRDERCDLVIGVGGGSVLDTAKAVAGMAAHPGSVADYLEDVGTRTLAAAPLPFVAAPTTAGSGSEATRNAVIRVPDKGVKRSLRHDLLLPRAAVVDPELSGAAPLPVAAAAGLDALTHLIESYVSNGAQPTTDALAMPGAVLAYEALRALADGRADEASKEKMALASLWGGIALANAGLGAVHGLVAPLGGRRAIAHGNACACLLANTVAANLAALRARAPGSPALARYLSLASVLGESSPEALCASLDRLRRDLGVPALASFGLTPSDIPAIVKDSRGSSMRFNPIVLTDDELSGILSASL